MKRSIGSWSAFFLGILFCSVVLLIVAIVIDYYGNQTATQTEANQTDQVYTYAYIQLDNAETIEGIVTKYWIYSKSDTVQLLINDKYYLTNLNNCILIADPHIGVAECNETNYFWLGE